MAQNILLRDVPVNLQDWIENERHERKMSQNEFILNILQDGSSNGQFSLFDQCPVYSIPNPLGLPFTFVDLFAGIGGFRFALERLGGRSVYSCEWDTFAQKTYRAWFGETPNGDIREVDPATIPDHDIMVAGFPCQPFSIAGVSKKKSLGREHGFKDVTQGTLFFHLARMVEVKRPPILLFENVKNLLSHDKGRTWSVIRETLESLDYIIFSKIIDAKYYVPQHRERLFIVGFDKRIFGEEIPFAFPKPPENELPKLRSILETRPARKYTLSDHLWKYLKDYAARHKAKGNGFGYGLADLDGISRTLSARYHKDGSEILIPRSKGRNPRRLTPRETARLMGFDDRLDIVVSDTQAYRQFGNAVVPAVVESIGLEIVKVIVWHFTSHNKRCLIKSTSVTA